MISKPRKHWLNANACGTRVVQTLRGTGAQGALPIEIDRQRKERGLSAFVLKTFGRKARGVPWRQGLVRGGKGGGRVSGWASRRHLPAHLALHLSSCKKELADDDSAS